MPSPAPRAPAPSLTRRLRLRASHAYGRAEWSAARNRAVFGAQSDPHEHEWSIEVTVGGPLDPATGWVTDLGQLDDLLGHLRRRLEGRDIGEAVPEHFGPGGHQPSTEELARWIWGEVAGGLPAGTSLRAVRVAESDSLWAECRAPEAGP